MMSERKKGAILSYIQVVLSVAVSVIYVPVLLRYVYAVWYSNCRCILSES